MDLKERNKQLEGRVVELEALVEKLLAKIAELEGRLAKNSSNSSKPPSSDIVKDKKPYKTRKGKKRKAGGQKNRKACTRKPFPPEEVDRVFEHRYDDLDPGRYELLPGQYTVAQQVELVERPFVVTEHRFQKVRDRQTGRILVPPRPGDVRLGLFGPRLLALTTGLKAELHGSYAAIQTLYRDALGLEVSKGYLAKAMAKVSAVLDGPYQQLKQRLPEQPVVHVDETPHREADGNWWTWVGTCPELTVFQIAPGRGSEHLYALLGEDFEGTLCSDCFSAYLKFYKDHPSLMPQYCWAHLIREIRFVGGSGDRLSRRWAQKVLAQVKALFRGWHRGQWAACRRAWERILKLCRSPSRGEAARRLGKRVWKQREGYGRFLGDPQAQIDPTNNAAERALRKVVLHRKATQGTRGQAGREWWERVFSVRATCRQQGRSVFDYLVEAINAYAAEATPPTLA